MNRLHAFTLAALCGLPALAAAQAQPATQGPAGQRGRHVLHLVERARPESIGFVDALPAGPSLGDRLVYSADILDRSGRLVGRDGVVCETVHIDPSAAPDKQQTVQCLATIDLFSQGQMTAQSLAQGTSNYFAITGGSGRFRRVRGEVLVVDVTPLVEANLTFTLFGDEWLEGETGR